MEKVFDVQKKSQELPIPHVWREPIRGLVHCIISKNYDQLSKNPSFELPSKEKIYSIEYNIDSYNEVIVGVTEWSWSRSVYMWMDGYWEIIVDIAGESGPSDLSIFLRAYENRGQYLFRIESVHVP